MADANPQTAPHQLPGQTHAADPKADALKDPANQLPTSKLADKKPATPVYLGKCEESQYRLKEYTVFIPAEHEPRMLRDPNYWMHHARRLQINDKIDCISMGGQWECTLRVIAKGDTWVKTRFLFGYDGEGKDDVAVPIRDQYAITHVPTQGYRVIHKETKGVISDKHQTKDAAIAALDAHVELMSKRQ